MESGQRVALVYSYCLIIAYFNYIDLYAIFFGSLLVFFLIFEVFSSDKKLVRLFSLKYKFLDFLYHLLFEFYGAFFYLILLFPATPFVKESVFTSIIFLISVIILAAFTSRQKFAAEPISHIIENLEALGGNPANCSFDDRDDQKLQILVYMEDRTFLSRNEYTHIVTARYLASRVVLRLKRSGLTPIGRKLSNFGFFRRYIRGYGTIEMQIIRNAGLHPGSYRLTARRKLFELLFSQTVFNSYINQLSKNSSARRNIKKWILRCYLNLVSVKIDDSVRYPEKNNSTFQQLFKKDFSELTEEEFFVWCLGLPHYENGVGKRAVEIHIDAVKHFKLRQELIYETICNLRGWRFERNSCSTQV